MLCLKSTGDLHIRVAKVSIGGRTVMYLDGGFTKFKSRQDPSHFPDAGDLFGVLSYGQVLYLIG
jgi:hypothetical protein